MNTKTQEALHIHSTAFPPSLRSHETNELAYQNAAFEEDSDQEIIDEEDFGLDEHFKKGCSPSTISNRIPSPFMGIQRQQHTLKFCLESKKPFKLVRSAFQGGDQFSTQVSGLLESQSNIFQKRTVLGPDLTIEDVFLLVYIENFSFDQIKESLFPAFHGTSGIPEIEREIAKRINQVAVVPRLFSSCNAGDRDVAL